MAYELKDLRASYDGIPVVDGDHARSRAPVDHRHPRPLGLREDYAAKPDRGTQGAGIG